MISVKTAFRDDERHAALLMGLLHRQVSEFYAAQDWDGLRQSHFRVVSGVPPEGISVTELGDRVGMSKQGCGQFVTSLVASGHLSVERAPDDRRVRLVRRTPAGRRLILEVTRKTLELEQDWATRVGERRYRAFRRVLEELALGQDD